MKYMSTQTGKIPKPEYVKPLIQQEFSSVAFGTPQMNYQQDNKRVQVVKFGLLVVLIVVVFSSSLILAVPVKVRRNTQAYPPINISDRRLRLLQHMQYHP